MANPLSPLASPLPQPASSLPDAIDLPVRRPSPLQNLRRRVLSVETLVPIAIVTSLFLLWEGAVRAYQIPPYILPAPSAAFQKMWLERDLIWEGLQVTMGDAVLGFLVGNGLAILGATIFVHSRTLERGLSPLAVLIQTIPIVVIFPFLLIIFGEGPEAKIIVAALISFFPTLVNMSKGLRSVDPIIADFMKLLDASAWQVFWKLRWPSSMPFLFSSLKITSTLCVVGATVGEWMGSDKGIGFLVLFYKSQIRTDSLMATVFAASFASMLFYGAITLLERIVVRWRIEE